MIGDWRYNFCISKSVDHVHIRDAREFYVMGRFSGVADSLQVPASLPFLFGNQSFTQMQPADTYEDMNAYEEWLEVDESG